MHRYMPSAPSEIDELEFAMLDLLVHATGASNARLGGSALSALAEATRTLGGQAPRAIACREAARLLRDRAVARGVAADRYRSVGWRTLGL